MESFRVLLFFFSFRGSASVKWIGGLRMSDVQADLTKDGKWSVGRGARIGRGSRHIKKWGYRREIWVNKRRRMVFSARIRIFPSRTVEPQAQKDKTACSSLAYGDLIIFAKGMWYPTKVTGSRVAFPRRKLRRTPYVSAKIHHATRTTCY